MYIAPNSNIRILKNVPLDNDYEHTLYFESVSGQSGYFIGKTKYAIGDSQYQRVNAGVMKVNYNAELLYDCNYLMFQNENFGSKWFYAFIKSVEYVNNVTSKITFEIDIMQTWWFECQLGMCYVEREHTASDVLFEHLQPEDTGDYDYILNEAYSTTDSGYRAVVLSGTTSTGDPPDPRVINNMYIPLQYKSVSITADESQLTDYIKEFYDKGSVENIVAIYQYPSFLSESTASEEPIVVPITPSLSTIDGYTPRNKKLFTYPYNSIEVSNHLGQTCDYQYENFVISDMGHAVFLIEGNIIPSPSMIMYPYHYKGLNKATDFGVTYDKFPQLPWISDTAKAYLAQHSYSYTADYVGKGLGFVINTGIAAAGAASVNPALLARGVFGMVGSGISIASTLAKTMDLKKAPDKVMNFSGNDALNIMMGKCGFTVYHKQIKAQFAKMIDNYFTMFGYRVNTLKVPSRRNRENYTYIKTLGCDLTGSLPADDKSKIMKIYDKGITFWSNPANVGNYSVSNNPIG